MLSSGLTGREVCTGAGLQIVGAESFSAPVVSALIRRVLRRGYILWTAVLAILATSSPANGQAIRGIVIDASSGFPLADVAIVLTDEEGVVLARAESNAKGDFSLGTNSRGPYRLHATRLGFADVVTQPFLFDDERALVEIRMAATPLVADTLEIEATGRKPHLALTGFYARRDKGFGTFLTRSEIDARPATRITDLLRGVPGVRVVRAGPDGSSFDVLMPGATTMLLRSSAGPGARPTRTCYPSIAVDGVVVRRGGQDGEAGRWVDIVHPADVEAVEVYTSAAGLPVQVAGPVSPCGSILIWTRRTG